jgi:hypothetical protein
LSSTTTTATVEGEDGMMLSFMLCCRCPFLPRRRWRRQRSGHKSSYMKPRRA